MSITEAEAATKWCPQVVASHTDPRGRAYLDGDAQVNTGQFSHHCIGSQCMMWRRDKRAFMVVYEGKSEEEWSWDPRTSDAPYYADVSVREVDYGHCGLAK